MKATTSFVCQECGYESPQWLGRCPECGEWNTLKEFSRGAGSSFAGQISKDSEVSTTPKKLSDITFKKESRILTGFSEVDRVLGGGLVKGSVILLAGDPGIGKSTLLLQIAFNLSRGPATRVTPNSVLYVSGEESEEQIKMRSLRLGKTKNLPAGRHGDLLLLSSTSINAVLETIAKIKPSLVIIDSIQTLESEEVGGLSGSIPQVRFSAQKLIKIAKTLSIPIVMVGHVTKEGTVAGPMILSHMVDTLLFLEGEKTTGTRILRSLKNRFGPVDEVGVFSMGEAGMVEVKNPEKAFLDGKSKDLPGSVLVVTMEGTRAFLVEIQALVVFSKLPYPKRVASGIDYKRFELLLAVLQKIVRLPIDASDVFVSVAGGLKLSDTASDLGVCLAIFSSLKNIPISKTVAFGEVGLLGELRNVSFLDKRVKQAKQLGFRNIITSKNFDSLSQVIKYLDRNG